MKRSLIPFVAIIATGMLAITAYAAGNPSVKLASTGLGKILVTGKGYTVYAFSSDGHNKDACVKKFGCTMTWPPVTTKTKAQAGPGLKASLLGTIKLPNGDRQVTYAGHPLYRYSFDSTRAAIDYVGTQQFGGHWDAVNAAGHAVK